MKTKNCIYALIVVSFFFISSCKKDETVSDSSSTVNIPVVTTDTVSSITNNTAVCGGNITSNGDAAVTARGMCWSTNQNPTIDSSKTTEGNGAGSFVSIISGLTVNTTYYARAYATNSGGTGYGKNVTFKTKNDTLNIDYFGQTPPGNKAVVFSPDFISRKDWWVQNGCFSPDGKEFVFCITDKDWTFSTIMHTKYSGGKWSEPDTLFINAGTPCISPNGKHLYYDANGNIYQCTKDDNGWQQPVIIPYPVSDGHSYEVSIAANGALYFSSDRAGGYGTCDLYRAELVNGVYENAVNLGSPINTNYVDECPYIAPDESYMVFNSWKPNANYRGNNIYITFRNKDGSWSNPKDLGSGVNTDYLDIFPNVTPDGKYLLFTIRNDLGSGATWSKLYWVRTSNFNLLKK